MIRGILHSREIIQSGEPGRVVTMKASRKTHNVFDDKMRLSDVRAIRKSGVLFHYCYQGLILNLIGPPNAAKYDLHSPT